MECLWSIILTLLKKYNWNSKNTKLNQKNRIQKPENDFDKNKGFKFISDVSDILNG